MQFDVLFVIHYLIIGEEKAAKAEDADLHISFHYSKIVATKEVLVYAKLQLQKNINCNKYF